MSFGRVALALLSALLDGIAAPDSPPPAARVPPELPVPPPPTGPPAVPVVIAPVPLPMAPEAEARAFEDALRLVLDLEGDAALSMDPADPGNWTGPNSSGELRGTKYGISARAFPSLDIANLTRDAAASLYRANYWQPAACARLAAMGAPGLAVAVFDCAVNQGVGAAARMLQQAAGAAVDGAIGPATLAAVKRRGNDFAALAMEFQARRMLHYASLSTFPRYGLGWTRRAFTIARAAIAAG